jgi:hypothetical protein
MYCGTYQFKTDKPERRTVFIIVGCSVCVALFLTVAVVGEPNWLTLPDFPPLLASFLLMLLGILVTFNLGFEYFGGGSSLDGDRAARERWANRSDAFLMITAPSFDDRRKVMLCPDGREFPFSEITIKIENIPAAYGLDEELLRPPVHIVSAWVGKLKYDLGSFTNVRQAKEHARDARIRVATGSCTTPWFPPDN